jgi:probable HAF family extracellular repeat protein
MRGQHFCAGGLICIFVMWSAAMGQPLYRVTDLGALPGPYNYSSGSAVSNNGVVTGSSGKTGLYSNAFRWTSASGMSDLGDLSGGVESSLGSDVNGLGHVVGEGSVEKVDPGDTGVRAFLWTPASGLQDLGRPEGSQGSAALGVNSTDQVVGHSFTSGGDSHRAFLWTAAGGFLDLGDLPNGHDYVYATAINDAGVVVGTSNSKIAARAFRWTAAAGMQQIADLSSDAHESYPTAINNAGYIVGSSLNGLGIDRAVLWTPSGEVNDLGALPGGKEGGGANSINNLNQVVGVSNIGVGDQDQYRASLWTAEAGMRDLNALLDSSGTGWTLDFAYDINDAGQIVGQGIYCAPLSNCVQHGYLLTPIPEPGICCCLIPLGLTIFPRRRVW